MECKHKTSNDKCGLNFCAYYRERCYTANCCKCFEPMTNYDRIKAMSIEEFCNNWVKHFEDDCFYCPFASMGCKHTFKNDCKQDLMEWLQQKATE